MKRINDETLPLVDEKDILIVIVKTVSFFDESSDQKSVTFISIHQVEMMPLV